MHKYVLPNMYEWLCGLPIKSQLTVIYETANCSQLYVVLLQVHSIPLKSQCNYCFFGILCRGFVTIPFCANLQNTFFMVLITFCLQLYIYIDDVWGERTLAFSSHLLHTLGGCVLRCVCIHLNTRLNKCKNNTTTPMQLCMQDKCKHTCVSHTWY